MSDYQLTGIRRRSLLATLASLVAALTVTRRSYGTEAIGVEESGRRNMRPSEETTSRSFGSRAQTTIDLKALGPEHQVTSITCCNNSYRVTTISGRTTSFSEFDMRIKTDSSAQGPAEGHPVLVSASMRADRAFVVFSSPREISSFIEQVA